MLFFKERNLVFVVVGVWTVDAILICTVCQIHNILYINNSSLQFTVYLEMSVHFLVLVRCWWYICSHWRTSKQDQLKQGLQEAHRLYTNMFHVKHSTIPAARFVCSIVQLLLKLWLPLIMSKPISSTADVQMYTGKMSNHQRVFIDILHKFCSQHFLS